jgi:hypothetical protein
LFPRSHQVGCSAFVFFRPPNSGCRSSARHAQTLKYRSRTAHQFHRVHLRGDLEPGCLNIRRLWCSSPVHRPLGDALSIMHRACQIGNAGIRHRSRLGQSALVDGKLMYGSFAFWMRLSGARIQQKTPSPRGQSFPVRRSRVLFAVPALFDVSTFNARVINGSMPFSISVFLLSSLMSTGTPLPS